VTAFFDREEPSTIVLVRARVGLGDLLCGAPALRALRARLPSARLVMLSYAEVGPIVERLSPEVEFEAFPGWPGIP
jgi:ADP-heptose:LPS heptosyltransferase